MSDRIITADAIIAAGPCSDYPPNRVRELVGDGVTNQQVTELPIPFGDRVWVFTHVAGIPDRELRLAACRWARAVLPLWEAEYPDDLRPRRCIETAERYARGTATLDELDAAWSAALDAALDAAPSAAEAAALSAARSAAAWAAARAAALAVALAAARTAARSAALEDMERAILDDLVALADGTTVDELPPMPEVTT